MTSQDEHDRIFRDGFRTAREKMNKHYGTDEQYERYRSESFALCATTPLPDASPDSGAEAFARQQADHWLDDMKTPSLDAKHVSLVAMAGNCIRYGQAHPSPSPAIVKEAGEVERLRDALSGIVALDDEDATVADMMQHDRNAGYLTGARDAANIARAALSASNSAQVSK